MLIFQGADGADGLNEVNFMADACGCREANVLLFVKNESKPFKVSYSHLDGQASPGFLGTKAFDASGKRRVVLSFPAPRKRPLVDGSQCPMHLGVVRGVPGRK